MRLELNVEQALLNTLLGLAVVVLSALAAILTAIATQMWLQLIR